MKFCRPLSLCGIVFAMVAMLIAYDRGTADRSVLSMAQADPIPAPAAEARWVVDPADPGPDLPPVGRSLFDHVITERQGPHMVYRVPFPFTALVQKIEQELDPADQGSPLKRVLIP